MPAVRTADAVVAHDKELVSSQASLPTALGPRYRWQSAEIGLRKPLAIEEQASLFRLQQVARQCDHALNVVPPVGAGRFEHHNASAVGSCGSPQTPNENRLAWPEARLHAAIGDRVDSETER